MVIVAWGAQMIAQTNNPSSNTARPPNTNNRLRNISKFGTLNLPPLLSLLANDGFLASGVEVGASGFSGVSLISTCSAMASAAEGAPVAAAAAPAPAAAAG